MRNTRNLKTLLFRKLAGRNQFERHVGRWKITIIVDDNEIMSKNVNWFN
jgi:hypothetical protein